MSDIVPVAPPKPAGWYPDPYGTPDKRWWSGSAWTQHLESDSLRPAVPAAIGNTGDKARTYAISALVMGVLANFLNLFFALTILAWVRSNQAKKLIDEGLGGENPASLTTIVTLGRVFALIGIINGVFYLVMIAGALFFV